MVFGYRRVDAMATPGMPGSGVIFASRMSLLRLVRDAFTGADSLPQYCAAPRFTFEMYDPFGGADD
jgi:hypothetical protein